MAGERVLGSMLVKIIGQNAEFDTSIDKSESKLESFGKAAGKTGGNLTKFITLPLVGIGVAAVKSASDMESAQIAFETLLGSGEKAKTLLGQLKQFASTTPFEFQDLAQGAKTLLSFGINAEKILPITKQLGDIALGDSEKFKSLSLVFGQITSTGRLMGQDLLQLINVGFNPLQEISKKTGESMAELKKRMEAGGISADEVADAFKSATSEGGRFFEGTEKLGKSFAGQLSTLKDDAADLARSFGELILPTLKDIVKSVSAVIQEFNKLDPETKKTIVNFALAAAAAGPLVLGLGKVTGAISGIVKAVDVARTAISGLATLNPVFLWAGAIGLAIAAVSSLGEAIKNINKDTENAIAKEFGFKLFDQAKTLQENSAQFRIARGELAKYADTVKRLGGDLNNTEGDLRTTKQLTSEQLNELGRALSKYQLLSPTVKEFEEKLHAQLIETEKAKKGQAELNDELQNGEAKTSSLSKAIAYQNTLIAQGAITEEEGLSNKIKLREDEIDAIIKTGAANGKLSSEQLAQISSLNALNKENKDRLDALKKSSDEYFDSLAEGYLESADAALAYLAELDAQDEAETKRQQSLDELADSYLASADEAIAFLEGTTTVAEDEFQKTITIASQVGAKIVEIFSGVVDLINSANKKRADEDISQLERERDAAEEILDQQLDAQKDALELRQQREKKALDERVNAQLAAVDKELQATLFAAGLAEAATVDQYKTAIAQAEAAGDAEKAAELEKDLQKLKIIQGFEEEKKKIDEQAVKDKEALDASQKAADKLADENAAKQREDLEKKFQNKILKIQFDQQHAAWQLSIANAIASAAQAIIVGFAQLGPIGGAIAALTTATLTATQLGIIANNEPKLPQLAEGGIVMPQTGGVNAIIAEAGQPEAVIPLDRMNEFIDNRGFGGGVSQSSESFPISLTIKLSERQLYKGIFQATRNRDVLIDASAVVNS